MAKTSSIQRNLKRIKLVKKFSKKRKELKKIIKNKNLPLEERFNAQLKLAKLPRNSARTRIRNRCEITGRPHGVYRKLKISRIALREYKSGNYSLGIKEHIIFPEINFDKVDRIRGMDITLVTSGEDKASTLALLELMNFPFNKKNVKKGN